MDIQKRFEVDKECIEKGRLWSDYIIHLSNALQVGRIPITRLLISFDVLISLIHHAGERIDRHEYCRFRTEAGEPADVENIADTERYYFYTSNDKIEVTVDMFAHPDTVEFV